MVKYHEMSCGCKFEILEEYNDGRPPKLKFDYKKDFKDCKDMWNLFRDGKTLGIFQLESGLGKHFCKILKPETLLHIEALGSILRPGCLQAKDDEGISITQHYCNKKNNLEPAESSIPALTELLQDSYGEMIFQEDIMRISMCIAGFDGGGADDLRKGVGLKDAKKVFALEEKFINGCKQIGKVTEEEAKTIFGWIKAASRYSFNKCLTYDTIVETEGEIYKTLEEIQIGDKVKGPNLETGKDEYIEVIGKYDQGEQEVYRIVMESGKVIKCTLNHKFLCGDGIMREMGKIILSDHQIICKGGNSEDIVIAEKFGIMPTVDIEVKSKDHLFYMDGLIGANSHSNQYGIKGIKTCFLKYHFPVQFFTAKLKGSVNKQDTEYTVSELVEEAKLFNIDIKLPSLKRFRPDFFTNGQDIFFGITNIKGIGESTFNKIYENIKDIKLKNYTFFEFCTQIAIKHIPDSCVIKLIESGSLDFFNEQRINMLNLFKTLGEFSKTESGELKKIPEFVKNNNIKSFIELFEKVSKLKKDGGLCHSAPRVAKLKSQLLYLQNYKPQQDNPIWKTEKEEFYLGIPISSRKVDAYDTSEVTCTIKDFIEGNIPGQIIFGGDIVTAKVTETKSGKNKGKDRAEIELRDLTGKIKITVWSDVYEKFSYLITEGNSIIVEVERGFGSFSNVLCAKVIMQAQ